MNNGTSTAGATTASPSALAGLLLGGVVLTRPHADLAHALAAAGGTASFGLGLGHDCD